MRFIGLAALVWGGGEDDYDEVFLGCFLASGD